MESNVGFSAEIMYNKRYNVAGMSRAEGVVRRLSTKRAAVRRIAWLTLIAAIAAALFIWTVREDWEYTAV